MSSSPPIEPAAWAPAAGSALLVTGAAGLIGAAVVRRLTQACLPVIAVDRPGSDGRFLNLAGVAVSDCFDAEDFLGRVERDRGLPRLAAVLHLGACTSTTETDADFLLRNNFAYTRTLAQWCLRKGVRFVYASSAATYGAGERGYSDAAALVPLLKPLNPYALSKHLLDLWALRAGAFEGPHGVTGLKYFNVYGPGEAHKGEMRSMVRKAFEQIQASGQVRLFRSYRPEFADGEQERDFLHVDDAAAITVWFLSHPEAAGLFNVGSGQGRTWNDLARAAFAALGRDPAIEYIEMPEAIRPAYQYSTCADTSRLRAAGCRLPVRALESGVSDYARVWLAGRA